VQQPAAAGPNPTLIDTRAEASCVAATVPTSVCLPAEAFFGPHRRLASARDISWVLGTAGLHGNETVLVLGADPIRRDAVAGLLFLSGQKTVFILNAPMHEAFGQSESDWTPGRARGILREAIHRGPWRDTDIILRSELAHSLAQERALRLLDGRPADEYWGARIRARRGGHLPGAEHAPAAELRAALSRGETIPLAAGPVVAYGQDPLMGLAYFTLLRAGFGIDVALYPGGWREWAEDGALPADAATYAQVDAAPEKAGASRSDGGSWPMANSAWLQSLLTVAAIATAGGFGYLLGRRAA
jgi:thiosulfate/3-mercaptopyruvate sulfurtransferase